MKTKRENSLEALYLTPPDSSPSRGANTCPCPRWPWPRAVCRCPKPTLVVEFLQAGQVAQHGHAVAVGVGPAAGVLCQPQHPQPRQRLQVEQLIQARDVVLPQVELAQVLALVQRLEVRDAVHAVETRSEPVPPSLPHAGGSTALPSPLSSNSLTQHGTASEFQPTACGISSFVSRGKS